MELDPEIYIATLREQRNQALDAAAVLQTRLIAAEREVINLQQMRKKPKEPSVRPN